MRPTSTASSVLRVCPTHTERQAHRYRRRPPQRSLKGAINFGIAPLIASASSTCGALAFHLEGELTYRLTYGRVICTVVGGAERSNLGNSIASHDINELK